jgi:hypothetical protein
LLLLTDCNVDGHAMMSKIILISKGVDEGQIDTPSKDHDQHAEAKDTEDRDASGQRQKIVGSKEVRESQGKYDQEDNRQSKDDLLLIEVAKDPTHLSITYLVASSHASTVVTHPMDARMGISAPTRARSRALWKLLSLGRSTTGGRCLKYRIALSVISIRYGARRIARSLQSGRELSVPAVFLRKARCLPVSDFGDLFYFCSGLNYFDTGLSRSAEAPRELCP